MPGLITAESFTCGARHGGFGFPPHPFERDVVALWQDRASCTEFLDGPVLAGWQRGGEVYSLILEPVAARGDWDNTARFPSTDRKGDGPRGLTVVVTFSVIPWRWLPEWYLRRQPAVGRQMSTAPGLLASSGGASPSLRRGLTVSVWRSERDLISAAYRPDTPHGRVVTWGREILDRSTFVRSKVLGRHGTWHGTDPLLELTAG